ncbi:hypothetical protein HWV62_42442 [Athelia sp. TMB]|nr:hypothetical protein HWV62_42442 [Athelia sp. TMB]
MEYSEASKDTGQEVTSDEGSRHEHRLVGGVGVNGGVRDATEALAGEETRASLRSTEPEDDDQVDQLHPTPPEATIITTPAPGTSKKGAKTASDKPPKNIKDGVIVTTCTYKLSTRQKEEVLCGKDLTPYDIGKEYIRCGPHRARANHYKKKSDAKKKKKKLEAAESNETAGGDPEMEQPEGSTKGTNKRTREDGEEGTREDGEEGTREDGEEGTRASKRLKSKGLHIGVSDGSTSKNSSEQKPGSSNQMSDSRGKNVKFEGQATRGNMM